MRKTLSLAFVGSLLVACGAGGLGQNSPLGAAMESAACPELSGGAMNAKFDANAQANATIKAFVQAAGDLSKVAAQAEAEVGAACQRMGADLGLSAQQMAAKGDDGKTEAACKAVSAKIDAILSQGAKASIKADVTPPQCTANANVEAACKGQCNAQVDPGDIEASCQPGQLSGKCEAACTGTCSGTCNGDCQGQCAGSTGAGGKCNGQCNGTCKGSCQGECKGTCSVKFKEPKCAVTGRPPSADARCEGSCKADADIQASCTPAQVRVQSAVNTGEMPKLIATLQANLPILIKAQVQVGSRIADDVQVLVRTGSELPKAFGDISAKAAACVGAAANATVRAQASIRVSVQASASISGKAGASGGT